MPLLADYIFGIILFVFGVITGLVGQDLYTRFHRDHR